MELLKKTNFNFMGHRVFYVSVIVVAIVFAALMVTTRGIVRSVEFTGGAGVVLHFVEAPRIDEVRRTLDQVGFNGVTVTTFGESEGRELSIRVGLPERKAGAPVEQRDLAEQIVDALRPADVKAKIGQGLLDLNVADQVTIIDRLTREAAVAQADAEAAAAQITDFRRTHAGVFTGAQQVAGLAGVSAPVKDWIGQRAFVGPFGLRSQELIEAAVSREMQSKAIWASVGALVGMLAYLWIRFHLREGVAAVVALTFDVGLTFGLFSMMGFEFSLPVVAAFLTLIGYSVNDKVVVFDRIREVTRARGSAHMERVINDSLNEVLSRTLITGICTIVASGALYFFGGVVLRGFAFVLLMGIIIGTYSSIYVACPFLLLWQRMVAKRVAAADRKVEHRKA